jgi:hypothetical protein
MQEQNFNRCFLVDTCAMCIIQHPSSLAFSTCHMAIPCGQHYVAKHFVYNMWPLPFVNIMWPLPFVNIMWPLANTLCQQLCCHCPLSTLCGHWPLPFANNYVATGHYPLSTFCGHWPLPFDNVMWPLATTLCQHYVATGHYPLTTLCCHCPFSTLCGLYPC